MDSIKKEMDNFLSKSKKFHVNEMKNNHRIYSKVHTEKHGLKEFHSEWKISFHIEQDFDKEDEFKFCYATDECKDLKSRKSYKTLWFSRVKKKDLEELFNELKNILEASDMNSFFNIAE